MSTNIMKTPKIQQIEYNQIVQKLENMRWLSKAYDLDTGKTKYDMTSIGGIHYVIVCLLLGTKSLFAGPVMNPLTKAQVDLSMNNQYVNFLVTNGYVVKSLSKDGLSHTLLTFEGAKLFFVLTSIAGKSDIPTSLGVKLERGMFKAINAMGRVADGMSKLSGALEPIPQKEPDKQIKTKPYVKRKHTKKQNRTAPKQPPSDAREFAYGLSQFPERKRKNWWDI